MDEQFRWLVGLDWASALHRASPSAMCRTDGTALAEMCA
jgi:hypothetical protein